MARAKAVAQRLDGRVVVAQVLGCGGGFLAQQVAYVMRCALCRRLQCRTLRRLAMDEARVDAAGGAWIDCRLERIHLLERDALSSEGSAQGDTSDLLLAREQIVPSP